MDISKVVETLIGAAERGADDLAELIAFEAKTSDEKEAQAEYQAALDEYEAAIKAAREWLRNPNDGRTDSLKAAAKSAYDAMQNVFDNGDLSGLADAQDALHDALGLPVCDSCGAKIDTVIGCPDGREIYQNCFDGSEG